MRFFFPYFMYEPHRMHHAETSFGTHNYPEYFPKVGTSHIETIKPIFMLMLFPFFLVLRFLVLAPISWVVQGQLRQFILQRGSTIGINPDYKRIIAPEEHAHIFHQELLVFVIWIIFGGLIFLHLIPLQILLSFYILYVTLLLLTHIQTLVAHRYKYSDDRQVTFDAQIQDSIVVEKPSVVTWIVTPLSLQYHSTHHLFPNMPYHALKEAHYRLKAQLPKDHPYHKTVFRSIFEVLSRVWNGTLKNVD